MRKRVTQVKREGQQEDKREESIRRMLILVTHRD